MKPLFFVRTALLWVAIVLSSYASGQHKLPFPKGTKRILFLGNSITYAGNYVADIESFVIAHYPKQHYEFIPAGLSGETVSGLSEPNPASEKAIRPDLHNRLARLLAQTKPDVVFACYGMNDGIYLPLDETRFKAFREGMKWLHRELEKAGAKRIIFLTPPVHDDKKPGTQGYNLVLDRYADWLLAQRDSLKWEVADLHFPMKNYLEDKRKSEPGFKLANDGVHPAELGHWIMARSVLAYLGEQVGDAPDVQATLTVHPRGEEILSLVTQRKDIMKDAWLSATDPNQPARHQGLPMDKARQVYDDIERRIYAVVSNKAPGAFGLFAWVTALPKE
ncbi:SGNH/GDSL hydrolase family protein [Spirosoma telluris]